MVSKFIKTNKYALATAAVVALIMIITLFCLRLGVSDNGMLTERLVSMGLYDANGASGTGGYSTGFGIADSKIGFHPGNLVYNVFKMAFPVNSVIPVALPAAIYTILVVWGVYMTVKALTCDIKWNNILLCAVIVLIVADSGYVAYFNTPYECAAAIAYFVPMTGALLCSIKFGKVIYTASFAVLGALFAGSMPQSGLAGIIIAICACYFAVRDDKKINKAIFALATIAILAGSFYGLTRESDAGKYNSVFYGVASAENSSNDAVLRNLKIIGKEDLVGKAHFEPEAQEFIESLEFDGVMKKVNPLSVAKMYAKNHTYLLKTVEFVGYNAAYIKDESLGNYPVDANKPNKVSNFFSVYGTVKKKLVPANCGIMLILLAAVVFFAVEYKKKFAFSKATKNVCVLCLTFAISAALGLFAPVLYFGRVNIVSNMIIFNLIFDASVIFAIVGGTRLLATKRNMLKEKYGVNQ